MDIEDEIDCRPGKWNLIMEKPLLKSISNKQTEAIIITKHHWKTQFRRKSFFEQRKRPTVFHITLEKSNESSVNKNNYVSYSVTAHLCFG